MSITIKFHKRLYAKKALTDAMEEFNEVAETSIDSEGDYYLVGLQGYEDDIAEVLPLEFANFALSNTVAIKRS